MVIVAVERPIAVMHHRKLEVHTIKMVFHVKPGPTVDPELTEVYMGDVRIEIDHNDLAKVIDLSEVDQNVHEQLELMRQEALCFVDFKVA